MLDSIIKMLEDTFPVNAVYVDVAKGSIEEKTVDADMIEQLWTELQEQMEYVKENGLSVLEYYQMFLKVEPYCNYPEIKDRIQKEMAKYE